MVHSRTSRPVNVLAVASMVAVPAVLATACTSHDSPDSAAGSPAAAQTALVPAVPTATRGPRAVARMIAFEHLDRCVRTAQSAARGKPRLGYVAVDRRRRQVVVAFASPVPHAVEQPLAEIGCDVRDVRVDYSAAELNAASRRIFRSGYDVSAADPDDSNSGLEVLTEDPRLLRARDPRRLLGVHVPVRIERGVVTAD